MNFDDYEQLLPTQASTTTNMMYLHMIAGGAAGILEHCVMYPMDSIKVRFFQNFSKSSNETKKSKTKIICSLSRYITSNTKTSNIDIHTRTVII